ncbi:MAG: hypothetical protein ACOCRX_11465 [Candidatus Woesearchaeota archaeon]
MSKQELYNKIGINDNINIGNSKKVGKIYKTKNYNKKKNRRGCSGCSRSSKNKNNKKYK